MDPQTLLSEKETQQLIQDFGIQDDAPEVQQEIIAQLGENIFNRLTLEILKILPEEKVAAFEEAMKKADLVAVTNVVKPHIPNIEMFVQQEIQKEIEATKAAMKSTG